MDSRGEYKMGTGSSLRRRDLLCIQVFGVFMFSLGVVGGILIGIYAYNGGNKGDSCESVPASSTAAMTGSPSTSSQYVTETPTPTTNEYSQTNQPLTCKRTNPVEPVDDPENQLFAPLTETEEQQIKSLLINEGFITSKQVEDITYYDNILTAFHEFVPNKQAAVNFLYHGGTFPGRFARVYVLRGAQTPPDVMQYVVGPLGSSTMTVSPQYADGELLFESRPNDALELAQYDEMLAQPFNTLKNLTQQCFDGAYFPGGGLFMFYFNGSPSQKRGERKNRFIAYFNPWSEYDDLHLFDTVPITGIINSAGQNVSNWNVESFYYLNQGPFSTAEELLEAFNNGTLRKVCQPSGYRQTVRNRIFPKRDANLPLRDKANVPPPRTYQPEGPRYVIKGRRVNWMGWSFDVTANMIRGPSIFAVNYKQERVAYEIGINDVALLYGSDSSARSNVMYTDSGYGLGYYNGIVPSVDCPEHATLMETRVYDYYSGTSYSSKSICVFESDAEEAEWRHNAYSYTAGLRRTLLVVRVPVTVSNYDYTVDFQFHIDGKLLIKAKATGMIQSTFWDTGDPHRGSDDSRDAFGFRVSDFTHGMIHDHMFSFKVDLDIVDERNSFEVIHFKAGDVVDALNSQKPGNTEKPEYFLYNVTRYLEYETIQQETGYRVNLEQPMFWTVVNERHRNQWGAKRGYQIVPLHTAAQTMVDSHPAMQALSFTKYHCAVTKHKDSEQWSTHTLDGFRLYDPIGDLEKKINEENIVNEDIVNWVTVGFLHIPTAEDIPMTTVVETGFLLKPFNFFNRTDVFDMPQFMDTVDYSDTERPPSFRPCYEEP